jgi:hypothetical protein
LVCMPVHCIYVQITDVRVHVRGHARYPTSHVRAYIKK